MIVLASETKPLTLYPAAGLKDVRELSGEELHYNNSISPNKVHKINPIQIQSDKIGVEDKDTKKNDMQRALDEGERQADISP